MNSNEKSKFYVGGEPYQCNLHYRSYDIDAFDELKGNSLDEIVIVTFTNAGSLKTVFEKIEETFSAAKKITLVLGFHHPLTETQDFKEQLQKSLRATKKKLENDFWRAVDLSLTLHSHCHIKYIQAGPFCFAGSQNFTGTISGSQVQSQYPKNELIISIHEPIPQLQQISKELLLCLHHESDEFVQVSQQDDLNDPMFHQRTYEKLRKARNSGNKRQPHTSIYRILEHDAYIEILSEFEAAKARDLNNPPKLLSLYQQINDCFTENKYPRQNEEELKLGAMEQILNDIEILVDATYMSRAIETIIDEYQPEDFSSRVGITGLSPASSTDQMFVNKLTLQIQELESDFNETNLLKLKIELHESALENLADKLIELGLKDEDSFKERYFSDLFKYICDTRGSGSEYVENSRNCPDSLTDTATQYVSEGLPTSKLIDYIGSSQEDWIIQQLKEAIRENADLIS